MKKWSACVILATCAALPVSGQEKDKPKKEGLGKVGVVNLRIVIEEGRQVKDLQAVLEKNIKEYNRAKEIGCPWDRRYGGSGLYTPKKEELEELRMLRGKLDQIVKEKYAGETAKIKANAMSAIVTVAHALKYDTVLVYGEPSFVDQSLFSSLHEGDANDRGPLFVHPNIDFTAAVSYNLNKWLDSKDYTGKPLPDWVKLAEERGVKVHFLK